MQHLALTAGRRAAVSIHRATAVASRQSRTLPAQIIELSSPDNGSSYKWLHGLDPNVLTDFLDRTDIIEKSIDLFPSTVLSSNKPQPSISTPLPVAGSSTAVIDLASSSPKAPPVAGPSKSKSFLFSFANPDNFTNSPSARSPLKRAPSVLIGPPSKRRSTRETSYDLDLTAFESAPLSTPSSVLASSGAQVSADLLEFSDTDELPGASSADKAILDLSAAEAAGDFSSSAMVVDSVVEEGLSPGFDSDELKDSGDSEDALSSDFS